MGSALQGRWLSRHSLEPAPGSQLLSHCLCLRLRLHLLRMGTEVHKDPVCFQTNLNGQELLGV